MSTTATITSKGQLTLPRRAREALASSSVEIEIVDNTVVLRPVHSVAGTLSRYARGPAEPIDKVRDTVWNEVSGERSR